MTRAAPSGRVVYAGRRAPIEVEGAEVLSEWDAAPRRLLSLLADSGLLVLLDPFSFPLDILRPEDRDVPVVVSLDSDRGPGLLSDLLGARLFEHLGPGDRVVAVDETWTALSTEYHWSAEMRFGVDPDDPGQTARRSLEPGTVSSRAAKERGRRRAEALGWLLAGAAECAPRLQALRVLDVEGGASRWIRDRGGAEWSAVSRAALADRASESAEVVVAFGVLTGLTPAEQGALAAEMWRVARPTGRLMVVDDVVPDRNGAPLPFERMGLPRLLLGGTGRRMLLDRVRSLRYPGEVLHRGAALSAIKTGAPQRW